MAEKKAKEKPESFAEQIINTLVRDKPCGWQFLSELVETRPACVALGFTVTMRPAPYFTHIAAVVLEDGTCELHRAPVAGPQYPVADWDDVARVVMNVKEHIHGHIGGIVLTSHLYWLGRFEGAQDAAIEAARALLRDA